MKAKPFQDLAGICVRNRRRRFIEPQIKQRFMRLGKLALIEIRKELGGAGEIAAKPNQGISGQISLISKDILIRIEIGWSPNDLSYEVNGKMRFASSETLAENPKLFVDRIKTLSFN